MTNRMKSFFLSLLMLFSIASNHALAKEKIKIFEEVNDGKNFKKFEKEFDDWLRYYYKEKDSSKIGFFLKGVQDNQFVDKKKDSILPFSAFLSIVFTDNPTQVEGWMKSTVFTGHQKKSIQIALWLSGNTSLLKKIFPNARDFIEKPPVKLLDIKLRVPPDLDTMWGAFLASGNTDYIVKIIDVLDEKNELTGNEGLDTLTRQAAEWSLTSNMKQHELVKKLVHDEAEKRSGSMKKRLEKIMQESKKK